MPTTQPTSTPTPDKPRRTRKTQTPEEKFWARIVRDPSPQKCWGWSRKGTGAPKIGHDYAHRVSWRLHRGAIPDGHTVFRICGNARCTNPRHLVCDTWKAIRDRFGGPVSGVNHGRAKLTPDQVRRIRSCELSTYKLAAEMGVSQAQVSRIRRGDGWADV